MTRLTSCICTWVFAACATAPEHDSGRQPDTTTLIASDKRMALAAAPPATGCYRYQDLKDTLWLRKTAVEGTEISGSLERRGKGKPLQTGAVLGSMQGDTLFAHFSYLEKGKRSVREVAFLRQADGWVEGSGATDKRDDVHRFLDRSGLRFVRVHYLPASCP